MHALISPTEVVQSYAGEVLGQRVAEVSADPFSVANPLFWVSCSSDTDPEKVYYDADQQEIRLRPVNPEIATSEAEDAALASAQSEVQV